MGSSGKVSSCMWATRGANESFSHLRLKRVRGSTGPLACWSLNAPTKTVVWSEMSSFSSSCLATVLLPFFNLADQLEFALPKTGRVNRLRVFVANSTL